MKKRLLITSIVMMLVVAVALGTSTYAWFTSNATVTASTVTLTANTNGADALGIGWAGGEASSSISYTVTGTLDPMAPAALTADTTGDAGTASNVTFYTATTREEASKVVFNKSGENVTTATPKLFGNGTVDAFYIKNLSPSNDIAKVTVTAVFSTENSETGNDMIRVAIFTKDASTGAGSGDYTLLGVLGNAATTFTQVTENTDSSNDVAYDKNTTYYTKSGDVYTQVSIDAYASGVTYYTAANTAVYGATTYYDDGDAVKDLPHYTDVKTSLDIVTTRSTGATTLAAGKQVDIVAVVWLDGTELNDSRQEEVGTVSLRFSA